MRFYLVHCLFLTLLLSGSVAIAEDADAPVELTLTPRAIESPILQYRLLPTEPELKDGNAAVVILRMPWDQQPYMTNILPKLSESLEIPLNDPRILANGTMSFELFYSELRRAAYMRSADWNYPIGEGYDALVRLPDVQGGRNFAGRGLSIWIRYQIAKGDIERAREGILVGLAVSRHDSRTSFSIVQHVSNALNGMMFDRVEELISVAEAPNLYWALTTLPSPMLDPQASLDNELKMFERSQKGIDLDDPKAESLPNNLRGDELRHLDQVYSSQEWEEIANAMIWMIWLVDEGIETPTTTTRNELMATFAARGRAEQTEIAGLRGKEIQSMTDAEIGVRWFMARHQEYSQQIAAYSMLPPRDAIPLLRKLQANPPKVWDEIGVKRRFIIGTPLNQYIMLKKSDQRVALLRTIEALRHYAALHEGRLPATLADITDIPVPRNPLTGEPFDYKRDRDTATLSAETIVSADERKDSNDKRTLGAFKYRIRMRGE